ncbi:MAG: hypothetical protein R3E12_16640 [Candidatus Eisenbacteria bacterium]|uniref:Zinc-finger domain-containing protein n=1 Tax=Eiseniibacteriota bacterium TaxID=2212470 RepID=A0A956LWU1_UNCEI|nr:hypothetical protein [Candidatus Eisenbacteria bacterium]
MTRCACDQSLLLEFALGDLEPSQRSRVEAQVRQCPACASEVRRYRELIGDLGALPIAPFPIQLEEVLVRSAIQARRGMAGRKTAPRREFSWTPVLCAAAGLAIVAVLVLILRPGNLVGPGSSVDEVVYGGVGRGATAFQDLVELYANIQQGWRILVEFLTKLAPVWRALRAALAAVGAVRIGLAAVSVLAVVALLWRLGRPKRKMGHANAR